jgi:hypothetical protein
MYAANSTYVIRRASEEDRPVLDHIAGLDSQGPITTDALIGEVDSSPAAAISLVSGRVIADPFRPTGELIAQLRARANGIVAFDRRPRLRDRIRAGIRTTQPRPRPAMTAGWPYNTPVRQQGGI